MSRDDASAEPVLVARLALPGDGWDANLEAGQAAAAPPGAVAALAGTDRDPRHRIRLAGRRVDRWGPARRARAGLVVAGGQVPVAPRVSVRDHLAAIVAPAVADGLLEDAPLLAGRGASPARVLSGGERRVLDWLRACALDPVVLVLDGLGAGLDPDVLAWLTAAVRRRRQAGTALVVRATRPAERAWLGSG